MLVHLRQSSPADDNDGNDDDDKKNKAKIKNKT